MSKSKPKSTNAVFASRRERLNKLGFVWDVHSEQWEEGFRYLAAFAKREGHCRVPLRHLEKGFRLGFWVNRQRSRADKLAVIRCERLDKLGFVWDAHSVRWEEGFRHLDAFVKREGHCRVPNKHLENGFRLGQWVGVQRSVAADTKLRKAFETVGGRN